jgi:hypothetical protein
MSFLPLWKVRAGGTAAAFLFLLAFAPPTFAQISVGGGGPPPPPPNNPPVIVSLDAEQVPGQKFRVYGRVSDETPGSCGVVISGAGSGTARCDSSGNFSVVVNVATLGQIQAVANDGSLNSAAAYKTLTNAAPTIGGFTAVGGLNNSWTFSGSVGDEAPAGLTVTLSGPTGVQGATATVAADGSWSVTLTLAPGASGNVTATVTDWYGLSGYAYTSFGS